MHRCEFLALDQISCVVCAISLVVTCKELNLLVLFNVDLWGFHPFKKGVYLFFSFSEGWGSPPSGIRRCCCCCCCCLRGGVVDLGSFPPLPWLMSSVV